MNSATLQLQRLLAVLGDPSRFRIVLELAVRERHVSELADAVGLSQSCTTRHLQALERAGAVHARRAGKRVMAALALEQDAVARVLGLVRDAAGLDAYAGAAGPGHVAPPGPGARAVARRGRGTHPARRGGPERTAARRPTQVRTPASRGASGTPAAPAPVPPPPAPTRPRSDLDDFLL